MSSATQLPGPMETLSGNSAQGGLFTSETCERQLELGITLSLFLWPSLSLAVKENWGGPESAGKREWFAQETIDLVKANPEEDADWFDEFLQNVMTDEFEVVVDDGSSHEVAAQILRLRKNCGKGEFKEVQELKTRWDSKSSKDVGKMFEKRERNEEDDETDGSDEEDDDEDVDMDDAPSLVRAREPVVPEIDEEGFTKVTKKKR